MKFKTDTNPKKLQVVAETAAETAWLATLKQSAHRVNRGAEKYVAKAYHDWVRANGGEAAVAAKAAHAAIDELADLASAWGARTNAAPVPAWREAPRAAAKAKAADACSIAYKAWSDALDLEREVGYHADPELKASIGALKQAANQVAQLMGLDGPDYRGMPWHSHARIVRVWIEDNGLS